MKESSNNIVKIALMLAGSTQAAIADQCGVEPASVNAVVNGRGRSKNIENRIAVVTGVPREMLWPQWYGPKTKRSKPAPAALTAALEQLANLAEAS